MQMQVSQPSSSARALMGGVGLLLALCLVGILALAVWDRLQDADPVAMHDEWISALLQKNVIDGSRASGNLDVTLAAYNRLQRVPPTPRLMGAYPLESLTLTGKETIATAIWLYGPEAPCTRTSTATFGPVRTLLGFRLEKPRVVAWSITEPCVPADAMQRRFPADAHFLPAPARGL